MASATSSRRRLNSEDERSEEHTSELQSRLHLVCRLLLEKKKNAKHRDAPPHPARRGGGRGAPCSAPRGGPHPRLGRAPRLFSAGGGIVGTTFLVLGRPPGSPLCPYTTLFRS